MSRVSMGRALLGAAGIAIAASGPVLAAEATVEAFSSWELRGQMYPTGVDEVTFVGVLQGVVYVKNDEVALDASTLDAGLISCPATLTVNTGDGSQRGVGKCVILTPDDERIYARFECTGTYTQGCNGEFTLTGGTGEKTGITGGGPIQFRSVLSQVARTTPGAIVEQGAAGIAVWPALTYELP